MSPASASVPAPETVAAAAKLRADKAAPVQYRLGQSLIGQVAKSKRSIVITNLPEGYVKISSGLGEAPIVGDLFRKSAVSRFTRTLGTLISAGVPILDALNITKETCGNEVYSRALAKVHDAIREGESMADPLRATKVCDAIVVKKPE